MSYKNLPTWDHGDFVLRTSLVRSGFMLAGIDAYEEEMSIMERECRLDTLFRQRKSPVYTWSVSDGLTRWLYDNVLKHIGLDPYKGTNFDQLRAYWLYLYLTNNRKRALKHLIGFILRLGFTPSLMENVIFKPQSTILLLATIWEPLKYLVMLPFLLSVRRNLSVPISKSTTNKITLLPTMKVLGMELPDDEFITDTYTVYFSTQPFIRHSILKGVLA